MPAPTLESSVHRRRLARTTAGLVGVIVGLAVFGFAVADEVAGTIVLMVAWPAILIAWGLTHLVAWWARRRTAPFVDKLEFWGLFLPMAAMSILAPLSLHGVALTIQEGGLDLNSRQLDHFGEWIRLSGALVGHAHLAVLLTALWFVKRLRRAEAGSVASVQLRQTGWTALAISTGVSLIPGAVLLFIPPGLTLLTGLVFVPWMFYLAHSTLFQERAELLNEALRQPRLDILSSGLRHVSALGREEIIRWSEPFRAVLHREPGSDSDDCDLHIRLIQRRSGKEQDTVALTLTLPREEAMEQLVAKHERNLPRLEGPAAEALWQTLRYHACAHGANFPEALMASFDAEVALVG